MDPLSADLPWWGRLSRRTVIALVVAILVLVAVAVVIGRSHRSAETRTQGVATHTPGTGGQTTGRPASGGPTTAAQPAVSPSVTPSASPSPSGHAAALPAGSRGVTFVNALQQTVWVGASRNTTHPLAATGWSLLPGASITVAVPGQWSGRFWGRTGCAFDAGGHGHCQTGDCAGGFQCTGTGATPATLAEFTFGSFDGLDFYDVSLVDGSNLPMYINISHGTTKDPLTTNGCTPSGCTSAVACPASMQVSVGGQVVACRTACAAFGTDDYCCRGAWSGRANCNPAKWPVNYTQVFKKAEPYAYSYAYDDSATMACKGGCYYRITFGVTSSG